MKRYLIALTLVLAGLLSFKAQTYRSGVIYWGAFDIENSKKAQNFRKYGDVTLVKKGKDNLIVYYYNIEEGKERTLDFRRIKGDEYTDGNTNVTIMYPSNGSSIYVFYNKLLPVPDRELVLMLEILNLK